MTLGCSLAPRKEAGQNTSAFQQHIPIVEVGPRVQDKDLFEIKQSQQNSLEELQARQVSNSIHRIPVQINREVQKWIDYFSKKDHERFQRFLSRGDRYREVVENVLRKNGLPAELYYLAMIESGYQNHATSNASAVGVWQFIRGTGRRYGLTINNYVDERRDPIRATEAAVRYLRDLHNVFGSWHLAMAGYNAGEYRVVRAVFQGQTRDFWKLVQLKALPRETRNYIPKFLAAVEIGQNPLKYGFSISSEDRYPDLQAIQIPGPLTLKEVASLSRISYVDLKKVNPHLTLGMIPSGQKYEVWVPLREAAQVQRAQAQLLAKAKSHQSSRRLASASTASSSPSTAVHHVRRGENLTLIARRYGLSLHQIKSLNHLRSNRIYVGMKLKVKGSVRSSISGTKTAMTVYQVKRGDNLSSIARRHGLSVAALKKLNHMRSNRLYVGARLKVPKSSSSRITRYRVKRGDNLTDIAGQFGTSVDQLKEINAIRNNTIFPGQILQVPL
jgi:membrane-bound lytic murein transglycosylase D